jgi:phosphopantetheinyl transferase (holo-ACP synthase)
VIVGIGVDLVAVRRFGVSWLDAEVVRDPAGRPELRLVGAVAAAARRGVRRWQLSLSHDGGMALVLGESA